MWLIRGGSRIFGLGVRICKGGFDLIISPTFCQNFPWKLNNLDSKGGSVEPLEPPLDLLLRLAFSWWLFLRLDLLLQDIFWQVQLLYKSSSGFALSHDIYSGEKQFLQLCMWLRVIKFDFNDLGWFSMNRNKCFQEGK